MRLRSFFAAPEPRYLAGLATLVLAALAAGTGCESVPSFSYDDASADATAPAIEGGAGNDGSVGEPDGATADGSSEAGDGGGIDSAPLNACLPALPPPPPDAGCCPQSEPCIGLACALCPDCAKAKCALGEYCCAQMKPMGGYKGTVCSPDGIGCS